MLAGIGSAYFLTPNAAAALVHFSHPRVCGAKWRSDGVTGHLCWSARPLLRCANAGPNLPNTPLTRFNGIVKQRTDTFDRQNFGFRRE